VILLSPEKFGDRQIVRDERCGRVRLAATFVLMQAKYGLEAVYNRLGGLQRVIQSGVSIGDRGDIILACESQYRLQHSQQLPLVTLLFRSAMRLLAASLACGSADRSGAAAA
jgi:hypothetical protein